MMIMLRTMHCDFEVLFWFRLQPATKVPCGHPSPCRGAENGNKQAENWWVGIRAV